MKSWLKSNRFLRSVPTIASLAFKATLAVGVICVLFNLAFTILAEKNNENYSYSEYSGVRLSVKPNVEKTPPNLVFDHSKVLRTAIDIIGHTDEQPSLLELEENSIVVDQSEHKLEGQVIPLFGKRGKKIYYNGFSITSRIKTPGIVGDRPDLRGRIGKIRYRDNSLSEKVVILEAKDGVTVLTGEILHTKIPKQIEFSEYKSSDPFFVRLEKTTYLPFIEDGFGVFPDKKLAVRVNDNEEIHPGDQVILGKKFAIVQEVWAGPGEVFFLSFNQSDFISYIDTRNPVAKIVPAKKTRFAKSSLSIDKINDEIFFNGQERFLYFIHNIRIPENAKRIKANLSGRVVNISKCAGDTCSIDYASNLVTDFCSAEILMDGILIKNRINNHLTDIGIFGFDVSRKSIPLAIVFSGFSKSIHDVKHASHKWTGSKVWATYTGLINQYYQTFNPSGYEYIIHALGLKSRKKYVSSFMEQRPEFVQISARNFDFTDFHGWTLSNSWAFYRLVLGSYKPVGFANYAQIWELVGGEIKPPKVKSEFIRENFPLIIPSPSEKSEMCNLQLAEVEVSYNSSNRYQSVPLIGRTPRIMIYVDDALSTLPISIPPDAKVWRFPIAFRYGQKPKLSMRIHSPVLPQINVNVNSVKVSILDVDQSRVRAMFLPNEVRNIKLCDSKVN